MPDDGDSWAIADDAFRQAMNAPRKVWLLESKFEPFVPFFVESVHGSLEGAKAAVEDADWTDRDTEVSGAWFAFFDNAKWGLTYYRITEKEVLP